MPGWDSFFVAIIGAAAALTGLIFVGVSINLARILSVGGLAGRALEALLLLLSVLVMSSLLLIPEQSSTVAGWEVLVVGVVAWLGILVTQIKGLGAVDKEWRGQFVRWIVFAQIATLPYVVAGVMILVSGADGVYWIVPGVLLSIIAAVLDAWVLLVEINR